MSAHHPLIEPAQPAEIAARSQPPAPMWWQGGSLACGPRGLTIGGAAVVDWVAQHQTPLYIYDRARIDEQLHTLRTALTQTGKRFSIFYAMKANRFAPVLAHLRHTGLVGIDACSPREVQLALDAGFAADEISVTASVLADRDLAAFVGHGVHCNLDSADVVRRYARLAPAGTKIGLRLDPETQLGYGDAAKLNYSGGKLGLAVEDLMDVAQLAQSLGLVVDTLHLHLGWGIRSTDVGAVRTALEQVAEFARKLPKVTVLNVGGGLGGRLQSDDQPLPPAQWGALLAAAFADLPITIACEPGTLLVSHAGLLVTQVTSTFVKKGQHWAGVNAGLGINVYAAHYAAPLSVIHVERPLQAAVHRWHIAGHINEAADVMARSVQAGDWQNGDLLAFFPAGAYGSSMASDHCLRGQFSELLV